MSAYSDLILGTAGLTGYWRLGESSGTIAADETGVNAGTSTSCTLGQPGAITGDTDTAYAFDGSTSYVLIANDAAFQVSAGSVECWFNHDAAQAGFVGIVVKEVAYSIFLIDNVIGFYDWGGGAERTSAVTPTTGQWYHLVLVFDSGVANGTKIYLNGSSILTTTLTISAQTNFVGIGTGNGGGSQFFDGLIDEVAIYDEKLSLATVQAHYNLGLTGPLGGSSRIRQQFQLRPY